MRRRPVLTMMLVLVAAPVLNAMELKPETLRAWDAYVGEVKSRMGERASGQSPFLWVDERPDRLQRVRDGEVVVEPSNGVSPHLIQRGMIHHWTGAAFVPKAKLGDVMGLLDNYERYKDIYPGLVVKGSLLGRTDEYENVRLLMIQKAFSVVGAVETDDQVQIRTLDAERAYSVSSSVRVQEIADFGKSHERVLEQDHGPGYVWRTFAITRLCQRDGGVYVEVEWVSLSRAIPFAFRWLVEPLTERLPRNVLFITLQDTRDGVLREGKAN